jgi:hypothetical protein
MNISHLAPAGNLFVTQWIVSCLGHKAIILWSSPSSSPLVMQEEAEELKKRVAVLECQLRKSEGAKKSFELSTGKLLNFVEV